MFGYVKAEISELKVKHYELYKSVYCGLCHHMRKRSFFATFSLSYDFVVPSVFALAFTDNKNITFPKKRCLAHPLRKRRIIDGGNAMQKVADFAILLVYYKLLDDKTDRDTGFFKRLASSLALPFVAGARKKILRIGYAETDTVIRDKLSALSECEKSKKESVYDGASIFGELIAEIFSQSAEKDPDRRCLHEIGYRVGRWIYIADALDDIPKDKSTGSYNPFIISGEDLSTDEFRSTIESALKIELSEAEKALAIINIEDEGLLDIIQNILYIGMPEKIKNILYEKDKKRKAES